MSTPLVSATDLTRRYGEGEAAANALAGVSGAFPAGRFTATMGPSGSGKSTLMHLLAGLDRPTTGTVVVDGVELSQLDEKDLTNLRRDKIGFMFQSFNLLPVLTAEENILLPLSIAGREPDREWLDRPLQPAGPGAPPPPPAPPPPVRAGRGVAAARRRGARARFAPVGRLRRRADGEPRLPRVRRRAGPAAARRRRVRPDGDHGHPRGRGRRRGRPARRARRRADRRGLRAGVRRLRRAGLLAMGKVPFRGLFARRARLFLTALAVALGVTLIAGTYVFTDTINNSFDRIFTETNKGTDVSITPNDDLATEAAPVPPIPASILARVKALPGVQTAEGSIFDQSGTILGKDGKRVGAGGAPNFIASSHLAQRFESFKVSEGHLPRGSGEVVLDKATARREKYKVGDTVPIQGETPKRDY